MTPTRVPTGRWLHAFVYTPDSTCMRTNSPHHPAGDNVPNSNEDVLPTQFHSRSQTQAVSGGPQPGCDPVQGNSPEGYVSMPALTAPARRKRRSMGGEVLSSASGNTADTHTLTPGPPTQRCTGKICPRTQITSAVGGSDQGVSSSHSLASPTHPQPRRMVLEAVEIISKRRVRGHLRTDCDGCPTQSVRDSPFSYYPTPPVSRAPKDVMHKNSSRPIMESEGCVSRDLTLPLKTSKYFACISTPQTRPVSKCSAVLTPPNSPILTVPVYIESSDFEYPSLDTSLDEPVKEPVDKPSLSSWHSNSGLFDDLMIMLRRLKPILVQGV